MKIISKSRKIIINIILNYKKAKLYRALQIDIYIYIQDYFIFKQIYIKILIIFIIF